MWYSQYLSYSQCPVPKFYPNMDSTLICRNSGRKITDNTEIRALRFNSGPKSKEKRQFRERKGEAERVVLQNTYF